MAHIISQTTMFDYSEIENLGYLKRLQLVLDALKDEELMIILEKHRKNGRNENPVRVMWNLIIAMVVFEHRGVASFRRECKRNSQLRRMCGLVDGKRRKHIVPESRAFTGFFKLLEIYKDEVKKIFEEQVDFFYNTLNDFGKTLAGDGKIINSYAKSRRKEEQTDNRSENDAEYTIKEYHYEDSKGKKQVKKTTYFGFKVNIICDVNTELPIGFNVKRANYCEKKAMTELLEGLDEKQLKAATALLLDRGYDSTELIRTIKEKDIAPVIDIRNMWKDGESTKQYRETNIVYNARGEVFIIDEQGEQQKMKYEGYDRQKKCLRYSYNNKRYRIYTSYDERIFLPIARDSEKFKQLYKGRTAVERLNGRLDRDYMFEDHYIRGLKKMEIMLTLSFIVMNGMAKGKITEKISSIRSLKVI